MDIKIDPIFDSPIIGFAHHKIILDDAGKPFDYQFLSVNKTFENLTGLKSENILNHTVREVLPGIENSEFNWIDFYGDVSLNGSSKEFEQFSELLDKWFKVHVYSLEKMTFTTLFIDITDIKKKSDELENFFNVNLDLLCIADIEGNFIKTNKEWSRTLGYSTDELKNKKFLEFVHPDDLQPTLDAMSNLGKGEEILNFTNRYRSKDGSYRYIEWRSHPKGKLIYAAARDITERILTENAIYESEANFRAFFDSMEDMVVVGTPEGRVLYANDSIIKKLGYSLEELDAIGILGVHPKDKMKEAEEIFAAMFRKERNFCPLPIVRKNGSLLPVETRVSFGKWNGMNCIFGVIKDLSAEQEALQRFNKIFENNPALMAISSFDDRKFTDVNKAFISKTGYSKEEIIGHTISDLGLAIQPEKFGEASKQLRETGSIKDLQFKIKCKSGEVLDGLFFGEVIESQGKKEFLTVMIDITKQKVAEAEALKASKAKSEFLANMSHEIRTPLNAVIGFIDLLKGTQLSEVQKKYVENANVSGHTLLGIINDILDFSKIEAGMMSLEIIKTDMIELLEHSIDIIKYSAGQKGLEVLLNIDYSMPRFAMVDPLRLKQILANLLSNAVKFTAQGEVELKVVYEQLSGNRGKFSFSVRDTGIGINQEQQEKLFKAFSQADSSISRKFGGTGLGLIISNMIMKEMKGEIKIDSIQGEGSTFYFDIVTETEQGEKLDRNRFEKIKRCLIIDDNRNNRLLLEQMLLRWNIFSDSCDNGLTAMKLLEASGTFDLIICDYNMPYLDGLDTIKMIREKLNLSPEKLPIILLHSSSDDAEIHNKFSELGISYKLTKPVKSNELFDYLSHIHSPKEEENKVLSSKEEKRSEEKTISQKAKVLIAEDVPMNRILIKSLLMIIMPEAEIIEAADGGEAFDLTVSQNPDIILMDVQMPLIDGITATLNIREWEQSGKRKRVPIIALTAGVTKSEMERCLESGMDEFLPKPIQRDLLKDLFKKYLFTDKEEETVSLHFKSRESNKLHFNIGKLNLRIGEKSVHYDELLKASLLYLPEYFAELLEAILDNDKKGILSAAHTIKGASLNMCFEELAAMAEELENKDNSFTHEELLEKYAKMEAEWKTITLIIGKMKKD